MPAYLGRVKRSFRSYQNEHNSVKDTGEKGKKSVTLTWKFPRKSGSTTQLPLVSSNPKILKAFQKKFRRLVWPRLRFFIRFHHLWVIERLSLIMLHWNLVSFSFFDIREIWDGSIARRSSTPNFLQILRFFLSLSKIERDGYANRLIIVAGFLSLRKQILSLITTVGYTRWRIWIKKSETREHEK